ncbi:MAG: purine-nucleoside phosphorylase [Sulfurovum sp.]|nr:MAG: purine-nucleoside phosphorylase [Sulfurovum sp.]
MFICAGESEQFDFAIPVGIGMTDVAINLTKLCLSQKPEFLFFVGTAGSYGEKNIFDIIESKTATNIENSFFTGGAYTPIDNMVSTAEDVSRETIVNSSNYITTDSNVGKAYLLKNIHLENMEYYAVLKVAKSFGIPAAGVFIVTNYCDENAHKNFMDNHKEAMLRLTAYIKNTERM